MKKLSISLFIFLLFTLSTYFVISADVGWSDDFFAPFNLSRTIQEQTKTEIDIYITNFDGKNTTSELIKYSGVENITLNDVLTHSSNVVSINGTHILYNLSIPDSQQTFFKLNVTGINVENNELFFWNITLIDEDLFLKNITLNLTVLFIDDIAPKYDSLNKLPFAGVPSDEFKSGTTNTYIINWTDGVNISKVIFSNNCSGGIWQNKTAIYEKVTQTIANTTSQDTSLSCEPLSTCVRVTNEYIEPYQHFNTRIKWKVNIGTLGNQTLINGTFNKGNKIDGTEFYSFFMKSQGTGFGNPISSYAGHNNTGIFTNLLSDTGSFSGTGTNVNDLNSSFDNNYNTFTYVSYEGGSNRIKNSNLGEQSQPAGAINDDELTYYFVNSENITYDLEYNNIKDITSCSYIWYAEDTNGNINQTSVQTINFTKQIPELNISISNKPIDLNDNLSIIITYSDADNDTWIYNETKWYIDGIYNDTFDNLTFINYQNTSSGQTWEVSARVKDTFDYSIWKNDSVVINDSLAPSINNFYVSDSTPSTTSSVIFTINATDISSSIVSDSCILELYKSDLATPYFNVTTDGITGDLLTKTLSMSSYGAGTLQWNKVNCFDSSNNQAINDTNINITISTTSTPTTGGGGSSTVVECSEDLDCNIFGTGFSCVSNKCIRLTREDEAFINLFKLADLNQDEQLIDLIILNTDGICNFDSVCDIAQGENKGNCGVINQNYNSETYIVTGDCTALFSDQDFPTGLLAFLFIGAILGLIFINGGKK